MNNFPAPASFLYPLFEMNHMASQPFRLMAHANLSFWQNAFNPFKDSAFAKQTSAALTMFERATRRFAKPSFHINEVEIFGKI